jgi:hypothetical protein
VALGDRGRDGEAVAAGRSPTAGGGNQAVDGRREAGAAVGDLDPDAAAGRRRRHANVAAAVLDRIGHEVRARLREAEPVAGHAAGRGLDRQPRPVGVGERMPRVRGVREQGSDVDRLDGATSRSAFEVVKRQRRPPQLEPDRLHPRGPLEAVERELRRAQRTADLVSRPLHLHELPPPAQVQRVSRQRPDQQRQPRAHAASAATGPSTSR